MDIKTLYKDFANLLYFLPQLILLYHKVLLISTMEYQNKPKENEFTEMVNYLKNQYQKRKGLIKRFEDSPINQPTALGIMLLYS